LVIRLHVIYEVSAHFVKWACYCGFVGMSVCTSAYFRNHTSKLHKIFYASCLWPWLGPPMVACNMLIFFIFDVMFFCTMDLVVQAMVTSESCDIQLCFTLQWCTCWLRLT